MKKLLFTSLILASLIAFTSETIAQVFVPAGLNPGDEYHLVFVTKGKINAESSDIDVYNNFANAQAALSTLTAGVTWKAIGSTETVDARDNALVEAPVYVVDGTQVATGFADMWDGDITFPIVYDQDGTRLVSLSWAGTKADGIKARFSLGYSYFNQSGIGFSHTDSNVAWIDGGSQVQSMLNSLYALSEKLTVPSANGPPTAVAGTDQSIRAGDTVNLDGSDSFDDNTASAALIYSWSFLSKPGASTATLDVTTPIMPSFVADVAGTYIMQLVVTDGEGLPSDPAYVEISSDNLAPTAAATVDFSLAIIGNAVNFDGSGSNDPESDPLTYSWSMTKPVGSAAALVGDTTATPSLTADIEGTYEVTLNVSDEIGPGTPATVSIVATTASGFAEIVIVDSSDQAAALTAGQVTTGGNQNAFGNFLAQAISLIQEGDTTGAIDKLNKAIARTDGCALRGSPDGNGQGRDWVTDCDAQMAIYDLLTLAIDALEN